MSPQTTETLAAAFDGPPVEVRPWINWRWQTLDADVLSAQLKRLKQEGSGPAVIVSRHDGEEGFGSPRWLVAFREAATLADEIEQPLWVQVPGFDDELLRPRLVGDRGQWRTRVLRVDEWETRPGKWRKRQLTEPVVLGVASPLTTSNHLSLSQALDITKALERFEVPSGLKASLVYRVLTFTAHACESPDCLCPDAIESYVAHVFEPLLQAARDRFGVSVQGVLVPAPSVVPADAPDASLPWSSGLMQQFAQAHGYDVTPQLPALIADTGVAYPRVRRDYWQTLAVRYREQALSPLRDWCHANGVQIGFALPTNGTRELMETCVDAAMLHALSDVAVIDDSPDAPLAVRTARAKRADGDRWRVILRGPRETPRDPLFARRRCLARCASLGADGALIERPPPPEQATDPSLDQRLHQWQGRGHALTCAGSRRCQVAVVRPIRSLWSHYHPEGRDRLFDVVEADLSYVAALMESLGHDFDLVDEEDLSGATVSEGRLQIGTSEYEQVVLPSLTYLPKAAWDLLVEFTHVEGKVAALGVLPRECESGLDTDFAAQVRSDTLVDVDYVYEAYEQAAVEGEGSIDSFPVFREDPSGGRFCSYQPRLCDDQEDARLRVMQIMAESIDAEVEGLQGAIRCEHRWLDDANLYVIANTGDEAVRAKIRVRRTGVPALWGVDAGVRKECLEYSLIDDTTTALAMTLTPSETAAVSIRPGLHHHLDSANFTVTGLSEGTRGLLAASGYAFKAGKVSALFEPRSGRSDWVEDLVTGKVEEVRTEGPWQVSLGEANRYRLETWTAKPGTHLPTLGARLTGRWRRNWQQVRASEPPSPGTTLRAELVLSERIGETALGMATETRGMRLFLNGAELPREGLQPGLGAGLVTRLSGRLRAGPNELVVVVGDDAADTLPALRSCFWLQGPFQVDTGEPVPRLHPTTGADAFLLQELLLGQPHYRGEVDLATTIQLPQEVRHSCLFLTLEECQYPCEALVNGKSVGFCWVAPHRFDATDVLQPGANQVELRLHVTADIAGPVLRSVSLLAMPPVHLTFDPARIRTDGERVDPSVLLPSRPAGGVEWN